jgi:hypothetical protein
MLRGGDLLPVSACFERAPSLRATLRPANPTPTALVGARKRRAETPLRQVALLDDECEAFLEEAFGCRIDFQARGWRWMGPGWGWALISGEGPGQACLCRVCSLAVLPAFMLCAPAKNEVRPTWLNA